MDAHIEQNSEISVEKGFITHNEIEKMASILKKRHGWSAYVTARHYMNEHVAIGDKTHASAWARVAQYIFETTEIR